jgi:hypothetical protein
MICLAQVTARWAVSLIQLVLAGGPAGDVGVKRLRQMEFLNRVSVLTPMFSS